MDLWQTLFMGLLQGATELFPISSLGHSVIIPPILHWSYRPSDPTFVPFLVLLHLGTAGALLLLYWRDWVGIVKGFVRASIRGRIETPVERLAMLLLVGTIPAGVIGLVLQERLKALFGTPRAAAAFLIVNGLLLLGAEVLRRRSERRDGLDEQTREQQEGHFKDVGALSFRAAGLIGLCQALALLPGISRSGATMGGGLLAGLSHREAARFSFLLATPIIAAAGLLEVPQLNVRGAALLQFLAAAVVAGLAAYASARFLLRYFTSGRLDPYGVYCVLLGSLALFLLR